MPLTRRMYERRVPVVAAGVPYRSAQLRFRTARYGVGGTVNVVRARVGNAVVGVRAG
ncbi:hypothetical protein [Streptomyces sp. NBC_01176]|uniref:hypothetical protein n=1 Tax=Streptomyces sp. NBC_01176 TaxID=2903760 RepID=UPI0038655757|nr:hypothetical protein OG199_36960 [Streptomyces sp. NBC_01176]